MPFMYATYSHKASFARESKMLRSSVCYRICAVSSTQSDTWQVAVSTLHACPHRHSRLEEAARSLVALELTESPGHDAARVENGRHTVRAADCALQYAAQTHMRHRKRKGAEQVTAESSLVPKGR